MHSIYVENLKKVLQNKKELERKLKVKISHKGKNIFVQGKKKSSELDEYLAIKVLEAVELGFSVPVALLLSEQDFMFEKLNIKDITRRRNLHEVRARIIGTRGQTLDTLQELSSCYIILKDNIVGIIGRTENILAAIQALTSLTRGSKQSNVYKYLEKSKIRKKKGSLSKPSKD